MREKKYSRIILQVLLLAFAGATLVFAHNNSALRMAGIVVILASVSLGRFSNRPTGPADTTFQRSAGRTYQRPDPKVNIRPGPLMWALAAASLLLMGVAYLFLRNDAAHAYHQLWPIYFFGGAVLVCVFFCRLWLRG
jgi:hypothetical protein